MGYDHVPTVLCRFAKVQARRPASARSAYRRTLRRLVPTGTEDQPVVQDHPSVLPMFLASIGIEEDVADPVALFASRQQVVTVEVAGGIYALARVLSDKARIVVCDGCTRSR